MDDGSLVPTRSLRLEVKILLKDRRETVAFEQSHFLDHFLLVAGQILKVKQQRYVVACNDSMTLLAKL